MKNEKRENIRTRKRKICTNDIKRKMKKEYRRKMEIGNGIKQIK